jgi:ubiquinone/menaquinone biosynthesis C-methylase UbiE
MTACTSALRPEPDRYFLSRTPAEYERLRVQAKVWEDATKRVLARSGLTHGMSCLDAGAGPGDVMRLMGSVVGKEGCVTGVDIDHLTGAKTLAALSASDPGIYRFVQADLNTARTIEDAPFDYVFTRLLLIHLPEPREVLSRLWSWVRPGGTVCVMDHDISIATIFPRTSPANRAVDIVREASQRTGKDERFGSRLPELFQEAGLGYPDGTDFSSKFQPIAEIAPMLRVLLTSLQPVISATSMMTGDELAALDAVLIKEAEATGAYGLWPGMAAAWKHKPK